MTAKEKQLEDTKNILVVEKASNSSLKDENDKGEWVFEQFYSKNSVETMFKFLDEDSSFFEELKIMQSLFSFSFLKAFFKTLFF